ncbi:hypothetical protein HGRIS_001639 [Hohenbuehelia grisea]|uniref:Transposase n=1 Tax=Hohenbuehelia grisea TaxID=104357 RepID=A0ABR3JI78_9AGAR
MSRDFVTSADKAMISCTFWTTYKPHELSISPINNEAHSQLLSIDITSALLNTNLSQAKIALKLGCSEATVSRVARQVVPDKENLVGGRPKKLTATDERAIISQINSGKAENAVQVTKT